MATQLKRMKIREISLVDEPASPGSYVILSKRRGGHELGLRFEPISKTDPAKVGRPAREIFRRRRAARANLFKDAEPIDADAIVARAIRFPPVTSERLSDWISRVWKGSLSGLELKLAAHIYSLLQKADDVRKTAFQTVEKLARNRSAQSNGAETFEQSFSKIARTPAGAQLLAVSRSKLAPPLHSSDAAKTAADELDEIARRIAADEGVTPAQAFTRAAQRFPALYARSKGRER